jgi:HD-GYP domain-containing protein (c-di-GMP phosphodiesterase class II)
MSGSPAAVEEDCWVPVSVESLRWATDLEYELYLRPTGPGSPVLFRGRGVPLTNEDIDRLLARGVKTLLSPGAMAQPYRDYLRDRVLADVSLPLAQRYEILAHSARAVLEEAFKDRDTDALMAATGELGGQLASLVAGEGLPINELIEVMLHDYSTYAHVTRVCTSTLLIAQRLGIQDPASLAGLAQGALLHDVGKLFISESIVAKNYRVTPEERERMRQHPAQGFLRLASRPDLPWESLLMVYQHHERVDGCGYPVGLPKAEIHLWARICAVANTHDALVRDHGAWNRSTQHEVLRGLTIQVGRSLDEEIAQCWIDTLRRQPPRS